MPKKNFKVIIIGGGPAGSVCALRLCQLGISDVLLIESGNHDKFRIGESIPPDANRIFHQLGIYHDFVKEGHEPCYGSVSYWGDSRRGYNDFLMNPNGHGWHLNRREFNRFLCQKAEEAGAKILTNTSFVSSEKIENGFEIKTKNSKGQYSKFTAEIIVDATGKRAVFATEQGSEKIHNPPLVCLGMRFKKGNAEQKISKLTHLEAAEYGWWYAASIPNEMFLVTLFTDSDTIKMLRLNKFENWLNHLKNTPALSEKIENLSPFDEKLKGFPAPSFRLSKFSGHNWLAIGDAATTYDPITAQGIMKGMTNAFSAAKIIKMKFDGEVSDFELFGRQTESEFEYYLKMRQYFYDSERRWSDSPFWEKMHSEKFHRQFQNSL